MDTISVRVRVRWWLRPGFRLVCRVVLLAARVVGADRAMSAVRSIGKAMVKRAVYVQRA